MKMRVILTLSIICGFLSVTCSLTESKKVEVKKLGPEATASLVVYFNAGTTDRQVEQFDNGFISDERADGRGRKDKDGIWSVSRLLPSQANNHEAIAITFRDDATEEQRRAIKESIKTSPIVYKVFENIAPKDIKIDTN
ncbi:MAG: hypothetical protein ACJ73D_07195 [Pyrinomonadaceae bacterium]